MGSVPPLLILAVDRLGLGIRSERAKWEKVVDRAGIKPL
jgi:hypothetical protein